MSLSLKAVVIVLIVLLPKTVGLRICCGRDVRVLLWRKRVRSMKEVGEDTKEGLFGEGYNACKDCVQLLELLIGDDDVVHDDWCGDCDSMCHHSTLLPIG